MLDNPICMFICIFTRNSNFKKQKTNRKQTLRTEDAFSDDRNKLIGNLDGKRGRLSDITVGEKEKQIALKNH